MTKTEQLKKIIEAMVRKEVRQIMEETLPEILPQMIKECMSGLIMEANVSRPSLPLTGNSAKRVALTENTQDEYPTMGGRTFDSSRLAELMGGTPEQLFGEHRNAGGVGPISVNMITEHGTEIPVDPRTLDPSLSKAFNTDYRDFLSKMNLSSQSRRGG